MVSRLTARVERPHPRAWFRVGLIVVLLLLLVVPHLIWRLFDRRSPFARYFLHWSARAAGADVRVTGEPLTSNILYIVNHVSWLDILALSGKTGSAFVAKADMAGWPLLGWMADQNNTVFVKRDQVLDALNQANDLQAALRSGQPVALFPEGTTANGKELLPFRSSLLASVSPPPPGIAIQPVAIDYGVLAPEIAWVDDEPVGINALRIMSRKGRMPITLHFLKPLEPANFHDRKAIAAHSRVEIAAALGLTIDAG